jgi:hypothetical protein
MKSDCNTRIKIPEDYQSPGSENTLPIKARWGRQ